MFLNVRNNPYFKSLSFRLTAVYSTVFILTSIFGFVSLYYCVNSYVNKIIDTELQEELTEINQKLEDHQFKEIDSDINEEIDPNDRLALLFRIRYKNHDYWATAIQADIPKSQLDRIAVRDSLANTIRFDSIFIDNEKLPARIATMVRPDNTVIQVGFYIKDEYQLLSYIKKFILAILVLMLIIGITIGGHVSKLAVRGIHDVTLTANKFAEGQLQHRVQISKQGIELELLGNAFNRMADRISQLLNEMKEVNDNIAHDIRSPLTRMRGLAETQITQQPQNEEASRICQNVIEECDILLHIINTMLDISEMESGLYPLNKESFDLFEIIQSLIESFQPIADEKQIQIISTVQETLLITGDRRKIQGALSNIMDNALKYTQEGGSISLNVSVQENNVHISISDTGIGINEEEKDKIFQRFYRGSKSRTHPGNGLGLCLVKSIAHIHGGKVLLKSQKEKGSTFTLIIPVD
jgi:signal transduction histidine kinase